MKLFLPEKNDNFIFETLEDYISNIDLKAKTITTKFNSDRFFCCDLSLVYSWYKNHTWSLPLELKNKKLEKYNK